MRRTQYPIHPDFKRWANMNPPLNRALLPLLQRLLGSLFWMERSGAALTVRHIAIPVTDGGSIRALWYTPAGIAETAPCLVYYHGGGFVFPAAPYHYRLAKEYALRAGCKVLFVDYRLAPRHPFPAAPEDCYAAYCYALAHAGECAIDPSRIAVAGDSAGGELATVVCLMARARGQTMPCAQLLMYPATGAGGDTASMKRYTDTPMCNSRDMEKYDALYMQDATAGKREYAYPIQADTLAGLPPAYIETAEFDCLRDGGVLYAERLREYGVSVELNNTKGTIHGFDIVRDSQIVRACVDRRAAFLRKAFGQPAQ